MGFEGEMAGVEELRCRVGDVAAEAFRARGMKYRSRLPQIANSGGLSGGGGAAEFLKFGGVDIQGGGGDVFFEVVDAGGAGDWEHDG